MVGRTSRTSSTIRGRCRYDETSNRERRRGRNLNAKQREAVLETPKARFAQNRERHEAIEGADLRFVRGDVRAVFPEMRAAAAGKNLWVVGGGDLAGQFHDAGLLDELILQVGSVTLGRGKPLFPRRLTSPPPRLVSARQLGEGFAELRYEVPRESQRAD